jgi:hypothetical protein
VRSTLSSRTVGAGKVLGLICDVPLADGGTPVASKDWRGRSVMIRRLASGEFRLYSRKKDPKTGKRRNLGTFSTRTAAEKHEREVQYFKRH